MTILYLPSPISQKESFQIDLESQTFTVTYAYNQRDDSWYFSLELNNNPIVTQFRLVAGIKLGYNIGKYPSKNADGSTSYLEFPLTLGYLQIFSPSDDTSDPNLENFGTSTFLTYQTNE